MRDLPPYGGPPAAPGSAERRPGRPIRLVVTDDHPVILTALDRLVGEAGDLQIVARCASGDAALQAVVAHDPDILLLDIRLPGDLDGLAVMRRLRKDGRPTRVVIFTAGLSDDELLEAARLGVRGVVLKEMAPEMLVRCLRKVHAGEQWLERRSIGQAFQKLLRREAAVTALAGVLTGREIEILRTAAGGARNREIADRLHISEGTVKVHLHNIYDKLGVRSRVELAIYARSSGLV